MQVSSFRGNMMAFQDTEVGMRILVIAALLITLAGCASNGTPIEQDDVRQIVQGQTTYDQMLERFGNPLSQSFDSEGNLQAIWFYVYVGPFGTGMEQQNLTVLFDKENRVKRYVMTNGRPGKR
ncbi:outer membrane protein assembly factor BamE [Pseudomonas aeruginosa]|nr:outer membrane protein assembly factor BamE [Pseudomonas aeruginosa]TRL85249.1 outer membrane protein assembly factor BamE [Pseudomonas aeruginosa]